MMNAVVVDEAEIEDRGHLKHTHEINRCCQLLWSHGANAIGRPHEVGFVPIHKVGDVPGFLFEARRHLEFVIGDFIEHLHIAGSEVPGQFPGGA